MRENPNIPPNPNTSRLKKISGTMLLIPGVLLSIGGIERINTASTIPPEENYYRIGELGTLQLLGGVTISILGVNLVYKGVKEYDRWKRYIDRLVR